MWMLWCIWGSWLPFGETYYCNLVCCLHWCFMMVDGLLWWRKWKWRWRKTWRKSWWRLIINTKTIMEMIMIMGIMRINMNMNTQVNNSDSKMMNMTTMMRMKNNTKQHCNNDHDHEDKEHDDTWWYQQCCGHQPYFYIRQFSLSSSFILLSTWPTSWRSRKSRFHLVGLCHPHDHSSTGIWNDHFSFGTSGMM